jgi:hypothetical protein
MSYPVTLGTNGYPVLLQTAMREGEHFPDSRLDRAFSLPQRRSMSSSCSRGASFAIGETLDTGSSHGAGGAMPIGLALP